MNTFHIILKELRDEYNLSQAELAKAINIGKGTVSMWESGKRMPSIDMFIILSDFFDCSIDYLVGKEE